jgi:hypothetical protein
MSIDPHAPVLIIIAAFAWTGGYLVLRPKQYKNELEDHGEDLISRFPQWAVRVLGVFLIVFALEITYLLFTLNDSVTE